MSDQKEEVFASQVSIAGGAAIFLMTLTAGILSDSVALLLDASTGLVVVCVAFFVRTVITKINNPPDHLYHFGYEKYTPLSVVLQNAAILGTCLFGVKTAIQDILHTEPVKHIEVASAASLAAAVIALAVGFYVRGVARRVDSAVLKTAAMHWFIDATLSFGMCAGFGLAMYLTHSGHVAAAGYVDPVMAILLSLMLMKMPIRGLSEDMLELLDAAPAEEIHEKIRQAVANSQGGVAGLDRLRCRKAGRKVFVEVCFAIDGNRRVSETAELAERCIQGVAAAVPNCDAVVHFRQA